MVFNPPTPLNYTNADLYSYERRKIQQYNFHLRYRPEIMSHTYIEISYNADLTDNDQLPWHRKIRFVVRSRKKFCSQTSCQVFYPRGQTCRPEDEPRIFKTGDHDIEACQFGCYHLYEMATMPEDKNEAAAVNTAKTDNAHKTSPKDEEYVRAPFLIYSYKQCVCTMHNNGLFAMGTDDYTRTDNHPTPRIDTIGTGFHYIDSGNFFDRPDFSVTDNTPFTDVEGNESFRFNVNRYYCDDFRLKFDGRKCYESAGEKIFGFLVSSSLYKACQYGVRYAATGVTNTDVQKLSLPPPRHSVHHDSLFGWKNDIDENAFFLDPNLSLEDLGFREDMKHCIFTTQYGYPGQLVEPLESGKDMTPVKVDYGKLNEGRLHQFRYDPKTGQRLIDEYDIYGIYKYIRSNPSHEDQPSADKYMKPHMRMTEFFENFFKIFGEIGAMFMFDYMISKGLQYSGRLAVLSAEFLENKITPTLLYIVEREMLTQALNPVIRIFSQTIAKVLRQAKNLIKTVDVFTTIAGILDLVDMAVDFFSMHNIMDSGTVQQYSQLDIDTLREAYGYGTVEYSPVSFMLMCETLGVHKNWQTTPNATTKLRCNSDYKNHKYMIPVNAATPYDENNDNSYEWVSEYIFALRRNSNGLDINWDDEDTLPGDVIDQYLRIDENVYLQGMDQYTKFTESFRRRVRNAQWAIFVIVLIFILVIFVYLKLSLPMLFITALTSFYVVFSYK